MKKLLSLILVFAMTFCACAAFAEEPDAEVTPMFSLSMTLPEGYTAKENWPDPYVVNVMLDNEDPSRPLIDVQISYEDIYSDVTFSRDVWEPRKYRITPLPWPMTWKPKNTMNTLPAIPVWVP